MENSIFRSANIAEHEKILKSEREVFLVRIISVLLILFIAAGTIIQFEVKMNSGIKEINRTWEEADYMIGFNETEESIIKELYGDFEEKADSLVWQNKSQFLDKEATTATGEMTYDEIAMEQFRQEAIAELKSQVDYEKVNATLEEHKAAYRERRKQELSITPDEQPSSSSKQKSYIYFGLFLLAEIALFVMASVRYKCIRGEKYLIADGVISEKYVARRSDFILRRRLLISYHGGKQIVYVTLLQTLRMKIGDRVYLIRTNMPIRPYKACKMD